MNENFRLHLSASCHPIFVFHILSLFLDDFWLTLFWGLTVWLLTQYYHRFLTSFLVDDWSENVCFDTAYSSTEILLITLMSRHFFSFFSFISTRSKKNRLHLNEHIVLILGVLQCSSPWIESTFLSECIKCIHAWAIVYRTNYGEKIYGTGSQQRDTIDGDKRCQFKTTEMWDPPRRFVWDCGCSSRWESNQPFRRAFSSSALSNLVVIFCSLIQFWLQ